MNKVELKYLLKDQNDFLISELPLTEYFDLGEGEDVDLYSVPHYSQPYYYYVGEDLSRLIFVEVTITLGVESRSLKQTFWNNGKNFLTERTDVSKTIYKELILSVEIDGNEKCYETIRLFCESNFIIPVYHGFFSKDVNNCELETPVDTSFFKTLMKKEM